MQTTDRPGWLGLLTSTDPASRRAGFSRPKRAKRNTWVIVGFFVLVLAAWLKSQM